jgi:hypothetical protein
MMTRDEVIMERERRELNALENELINRGVITTTNPDFARTFKSLGFCVKRSRDYSYHGYEVTLLDKPSENI